MDSESGTALRTITNLSVNNHDDASGDLCAVEYVNFVAGHPHSDRGNDVVSEVLAAFGREANDHNEPFRKLAMANGRTGKPIILAMLNTAGTIEVERERAYYFANLARHAATRALETAGLFGDADMLRALPSIKDRDTAEAMYGACTKINLVHADDMPRRYSTHVVSSAGDTARHASNPDQSVARCAAAAKSAYEAIDPDGRNGEAVLEALLEACSIREAAVVTGATP